MFFPATLNKAKWLWIRERKRKS